jgi:hypothetical protein
MAKRSKLLIDRKQRSILTDMLPFEVPPTFSNRGFYRFIRAHEIEIVGSTLRWTCDTSALDRIIYLIFGVDDKATVSSTPFREWGKKEKSRRSVPLNKCRMNTNPFAFTISHNTEGRVLSVVHPRNQLQVADFYNWYSTLITYYSSISEYSIRYPAGVAQYSYYKDGLYELRKETGSGIEVEDREYNQSGSYFTYNKYRNIHRFFESYSYHRSEKIYDAMVKVDLSRCFDSIYTHSLAWAVLGNEQTKFHMEESKGTFGDRFDVLLQNMNNNETNGIVIGPEFSRIFAEIILQAVDREVIERLRIDHKLQHRVNYRSYRYVDDFFIFYNEESTKILFLEVLQNVLRKYKLSINSAKTKDYKKPIITEITIAKEAISALLNDAFSFELETVLKDGTEEIESSTIKGSIQANRLIVKYKAILKTADASYGDLLNYTLAIVERKTIMLVDLYKETLPTVENQRKIVNVMLATLEFVFFIYSASPRVNHTIRTSRICVGIVSLLNNKAFPKDLKHLVFKYIHDNVIQLLSKNTMTKFREVENLYLLLALKETGRDYWLPEGVLRTHAAIEIDVKDGSYIRNGFLSHFSITVLLSYMMDKVRYRKIRQFLQHHAVEKLEHVKLHCPGDTEALMLFLDLLVCPYVEDSTKEKLGKVFGVDAATWPRLRDHNDHWFTAWGKRFDLGKELDAKRGREVY